MPESQILVQPNSDGSHMGSDLSVVNAARKSFGDRSEYIEDSFGWRLPDKDKRLIQYLARGMSQDEYVGFLNDFNYETMADKLWKFRDTPEHDTPFNHMFMSFEVKAPVFVARQLVKHEYLVWSEYSRRYKTDDVEFYTPDTWRTKVENVKQGSSTEPKPHPDFTQGFCINCGTKITQATRKQGGGCVKKYCNSECKSIFTNRHRDPYKTAFQNAKARVLREGKRLWGLTHEDMVYPEYCPYLGIRLDYSIGDKGSPKDNSPSFDRIDSLGGYTHDNVQIISNLANSMKNSATKEQQVDFARKVLLMHEGYVVDDAKTYKGQMKNVGEVYNSLIDSGYPAEQARMVLPQSLMTSWTWSGSFGAFAKMLRLRLAEDSQYETRLVAQQIANYAKEWFPLSYKALVERDFS